MKGINLIESFKTRINIFVWKGDAAFMQETGDDGSYFLLLSEDLIYSSETGCLYNLTSLSARRFLRFSFYYLFYLRCTSSSPTWQFFIFLFFPSLYYEIQAIRNNQQYARQRKQLYVSFLTIILLWDEYG